MRLHYLVKRKIRVFCENSNAGKAKLKKFYLLTLILLIEKRCNFLTLTSRYGKFNQENVYQTVLESASFCRRYDKTFRRVFGSQF